MIVKAVEISSPTLADAIKFDTTSTALGNVIEKPKTIKEGVDYTLNITFEVDKQVMGLTFRQIVKHAGLTVSDIEKTVVCSVAPLVDYVVLIRCRAITHRSRMVLCIPLQVGVVWNLQGD